MVSGEGSRTWQRDRSGINLDAKKMSYQRFKAMLSGSQSSCLSPFHDNLQERRLDYEGIYMNN